MASDRIDEAIRGAVHEYALGGCDLDGVCAAVTGAIESALDRAKRDVRTVTPTSLDPLLLNLQQVRLIIEDVQAIDRRALLGDDDA